MGEVSPAALISGADLATQMGLTVGTPHNGSSGWLKFFDKTDNKIKYIAKKSFRHSLTRNQLSSVNLITGNREIVIGGKTYKVRLVKGAGSNPSQNNAGNDAAGSHGSEWNRLMYHVCNGVAADVFTSEGGNKDWAEYTDVDLGLGPTVAQGSFTMCQETHGANANFVVCRGYGGAAGSVTYFGYTAFTDTAARMGWRPLLELVS